MRKRNEQYEEAERSIISSKACVRSSRPLARPLAPSHDFSLASRAPPPLPPTLLSSLLRSGVVSALSTARRRRGLRSPLRGGVVSVLHCATEWSLISSPLRGSSVVSALHCAAAAWSTLFTARRLVSVLCCAAAAWSPFFAVRRRDISVPRRRGISAA